MSEPVPVMRLAYAGTLCYALRVRDPEVTRAGNGACTPVFIVSSIVWWADGRIGHRSNP